MEQSFAEACRVLKPGGQISVVYAHKTTLGWATLIDALRRAGFTVMEAWPLDTERAGRLRAMDSAALATSITLVSRKRDGAKTGSYEEEVRPELEQIVRERVETLWLMEHEPRKLPAFLDEARPDRVRLRLVAQALAGAGLSGGSEDQTGVVNTTPGEQAALGKLLANWRALVPETLFAR